MSPRDRSPVWTLSHRQPSGKDHWKQWSPYNLTLLQLEQTSGSSGQRGTEGKKQTKKHSPEIRALSLEEEKGQVLKPPLVSMYARNYTILPSSHNLYKLYTTRKRLA